MFIFILKDYYEGHFRDQIETLIFTLKLMGDIFFNLKYIN